MVKSCLDCKKAEPEIEFPHESARCATCRKAFYKSRMPKFSSGEFICSYRKKLGLSQSEVASVLGIERRKYCAIENGVCLEPTDFISNIQKNSDKLIEISKEKSIYKLIKSCPMCRRTSQEVNFTPKGKRCKECEKAYHDKWYQENKEDEFYRIKKWQKENSEKCKQHRKSSYNKHKTSRLKTGKQWRKNNQTKMADLKRNWRKMNPEKDAEYNHKRRVRGGRSFNAEELKLLFTLFPACLNCGSSTSLEVDHVVPLALGGSNKMGNLQILCATCNRSKGATAIEYRRLHQIEKLSGKGN